jgi:hypothetical protein
MTTTPPELPASARLAAALGRAVPAPLSEVERRVWDERQDQADRELERLYRLGQRAA